MIKLSNDKKIKLFEVVVYLLTVYILLFQFSSTLLMIGLVMGWFTYLLGHHASLHFYSSHKAYEPKNRYVKWFILTVGTLAGAGSNIMWAATHRLHHKHSDTDKDPHSPVYIPSWKLWFHYFPIELINVRIVKDLSTDVDHKFFHNYYYHIHAIYVGILALFDPIYIGYFWALPIVYAYFATNLTIVTLHSPMFKWILGGKQRYPTGDQTFNSNIIALFSPGAGMHNNHHRYPSAANNNQHKGDIDLAYWFIKLVGKDIKEIRK